MSKSYDDAAYDLSEQLTRLYSTSFSLASRLFPARMRRHIFAIYGVVRVADEIVDTYRGADAEAQLKALEARVYDALKSGYSSDVIVHAFALTARAYGIERELIAPFFASMQQDLHRTVYDQKQYEDYIYGSAEVVGLMCLRVFVPESTYETLAPGARALGAAFQKINFLRDLRDDGETLGRYYFPIGSLATFDNTIRDSIISDIASDLAEARAALKQLPPSSRYAVAAALQLFDRLLATLAKTPAEEIRQNRVRVADRTKLGIFMSLSIRKKFHLAAV